MDYINTNPQYLGSPFYEPDVSMPATPSTQQEQDYDPSPPSPPKRRRPRSPAKPKIERCKRTCMRRGGRPGRPRNLPKSPPTRGLKNRKGELIFFCQGCAWQAVKLSRLLTHIARRHRNKCGLCIWAVHWPDFQGALRTRDEIVRCPFCTNDRAVPARRLERHVQRSHSGQPSARPRSPRTRPTARRPRGVLARLLRRVKARR